MPVSDLLMWPTHAFAFRQIGVVDHSSKFTLEVFGRLPKFADWAEARKEDDTLLTEWQVYRMLDARRGAWSTFQFLVRERLDEQGVRVSTDGRLLKKR